MDVLVDTCVWSEVLRKKAPNPDIKLELNGLVGQGCVKMIGLIRQELLTGIKFPNQFEMLRSKLSFFPDVPISTDIYEYAAELSNACMSKGIQGSNVDFLICAVAKKHRFLIYTIDGDFANYSKTIDLEFYDP